MCENFPRSNNVHQVIGSRHSSLEVVYNEVEVNVPAYPHLAVVARA